jgi:hypothetical protein
VSIEGTYNSVRLWKLLVPAAKDTSFLALRVRDAGRIRWTLLATLPCRDQPPEQNAHEEESVNHLSDGSSHVQTHYGDVQLGPVVEASRTCREGHQLPRPARPRRRPYLLATLPCRDQPPEQNAHEEESVNHLSDGSSHVQLVESGC